MREVNNEVIEALAELEHDQWMNWASAVMLNEDISDARRVRWTSYMVPYSKLTDEVKEHDRVWARKTLKIMEDVCGR